MDLVKLVKIIKLVALYYPQAQDLVTRFLADLEAAKPLMSGQHHKHDCDEVLKCLDCQAECLLSALEHNAHLYHTLCCEPCEPCDPCKD